MAYQSGDDINYYFQNDNGKIFKFSKYSNIKEEQISTVDTNYTKIAGGYNQQSSSPLLQQQHCGMMQDDSETNSFRQSLAMKYESSNSLIAENNALTIGKYQSKIQKNTNQYPQKSKNQINTTSLTSIQKKRKPEKVGKGLRHFSMKVCEKVKEKGATTYNEVADELVAEEIQNQSHESGNCDQKNIRRRVYDALNVLMAMNIISKDKKEIRWIGLPTNSIEQFSALEKENAIRRERIQAKHQQLRELLFQQVSFKNLIERNRDAEQKGIVPAANSSIELPFIIVNTHKSTKVHCCVTNDKSEYVFNFDDHFEIHDDAEVLKRMGLLLGLDKGSCSYEDIERAKTMVPKNFEKYIEAYGSDGNVNYEENDEMIDEADISIDSQRLQIDDSQVSEINDEDYVDESDIE